MCTTDLLRALEYVESYPKRMLAGAAAPSTIRLHI